MHYHTHSNVCTMQTPIQICGIMLLIYVNSATALVNYAYWFDHNNTIV